MSKINYIIREDGSPKLFSVETEFDFLDLDEILEDYPYILDSMENEEYYIENDICSFFDEILFENKVVGFATYDTRNMTDLLLCECYILPEFRGKRLFFDEICKMIFIAENFGILQPTRNIVDLLVDYSFAKNVTEDIVVSGIPFYFDEIDAKSYKNRELDEDEMDPSYFYDLSINSTISVDNDDIIYHNLLENDLRRHGKRKELDESYFTNIKDFFTENDFDDVIEELIKNLPQIKFGYDEIIGNGEGLSDYMQSIVDNGMISYDKAIEIKQQLISEFESGQLKDEDIDERFTVLISNELSDSLQLDFMNDLLDFDSENEDEQMLKSFFDLIGQDEKLTENIFNAMINDDFNEFEKLMMNAMEDEKFSDEFITLVENMKDEEDDLMDFSQQDIDFIESLGLNLDSPYPVAEMMWGPNDDKYKLDDTYYGKDYPISYDIYIFRVLNSIKKHNNLKIALATAEMKGSATSQLMESTLFENEFINNEVNYENWNEFANNELTIPDLKDILRQNNLKISGKKQELIDRISENQIPLDEFESEKVSITPLGEEFLQENSWIKLYDDFLNKFDFNDYVKYLDNNEGELIEVTLKYLEEHLKLAKKENDSDYIKDCSIAHDMISTIDYFS